MPRRMKRHFRPVQNTRWQVILSASSTAVGWSVPKKDCSSSVVGSTLHAHTGRASYHLRQVRPSAPLSGRRVVHQHQPLPQPPLQSTAPSKQVVYASRHLDKHHPLPHPHAAEPHARVDADLGRQRRSFKPLPLPEPHRLPLPVEPPEWQLHRVARQDVHVPHRCAGRHHAPASRKRPVPQPRPRLHVVQVHRACVDVRLRSHRGVRVVGPRRAYPQAPDHVEHAIHRRAHAAVPPPGGLGYHAPRVAPRIVLVHWGRTPAASTSGDVDLAGAGGGCELLPRGGHRRSGGDRPRPSIVADHWAPADNVDPRANRGQAWVRN